MPAQKFYAGAATSNITPALGVSMNGGMHDRAATHIHDELHARCLVLDDGQTRIGIVVCDSCMIPAYVLDRAKHMAHEHTELPPDRMLISATHTHSAPTTAGVFQSEPDEEYIEFLVLRIADGLRRATSNLAPARVGWGAGREPSQVFNRRWRMKPGTISPDPFGGTADQVKMNPPRSSADLLEPAGPVDSEVAMLAVTTLQGRPVALLANYSLHYVGGVSGGHCSADYFAMFADRMAELLRVDRLDPPFVGILSNGTSGNINNIDFRQASSRQAPYEQMRKVAHVVAAEAHRAYQQIRFYDHVRLDMRETRLELGRRLPSPEEVARAKIILGRGTGPQLRRVEEIYARETVLMSEWPDSIQTVVQALRVGELGIAAIPCEVFVETGLAIKSESPFESAFTIELANDYCGYLPTVEHHKLGGYETWRARSSFLEVEAEPKIRRAVLEAFGKLT